MKLRARGHVFESHCRPGNDRATCIAHEAVYPGRLHLGKRRRREAKPKPHQ